ncbi:MAG: hypothetical protein P8179_04370 [Candidatus Thiodiazotropha sp.]|jgi:hypothetical protein
MKKSYMTTLIGLFGSLVLSSALYAAGTDAASEVETASEVNAAGFGTLDTNQDGSLSPDEAASDSQLSKSWGDIDADENGAIDQAEFSAFEVLRDSLPKTSEEPSAPSEPSLEMEPKEPSS